MHLTKGFGSIALLFVVLVGLLAFGGLAFFSIQYNLRGSQPQSQKQTANQETTETPTELSSEVSDSTEIEVLKQELEETEVAEIESEFEAMQSSAAGL